MSTQKLTALQALDHEAIAAELLAGASSDVPGMSELLAAMSMVVSTS